MLKVASPLFCNRDQGEEERALEKEKRKEKKEALLLSALQGPRPMMPTWESPKALLPATAINAGSPDAGEGSAWEGPPKIPCPLCHWKRNCPRTEGPQTRIYPQDGLDLKGPVLQSSPAENIIIEGMEPG